MIGFLVSRAIDAFVAATGRRQVVADIPWLDSPTGDGGAIGEAFYARCCAREGWTLCTDQPAAGLIPSFAVLKSTHFDPERVIPEVRDFYEHTAGYEFDVWSQWRGPLTPFAHALVTFASRELQQCNLPLSSLDTSGGVASSVWPILDNAGNVVYTGWLRQFTATKNVLFVGLYTTATPPGWDGVGIKVVFPLPRGAATVIFRPENQPDGSFKLISGGKQFGAPGFYRLFRQPDGTLKAAYLPLHEEFHLYVDAEGVFRTNHKLTYAGLHFLTLHYRMRRKESAVAKPTLERA